MNQSTKLQPLIIISAAMAGIALGLFSRPDIPYSLVIEPALMVLLFFVFLSIDLRGIKKAFHNRRFAAASLLVNFIWTPVFAFLLGKLFLNHSIDLRTGFLMLMVTPCTDWYLVFTGLSNGNVELNTMILPLNLLLQILLLPVYLFLFLGGELQMVGLSMVLSIVIVLVIPFAAAQVVRILLGKTSPTALSGLQERGDSFQLLFLCTAIVCMFASESRSIFASPAILLSMLPPTLLFFAFNFLLAQILGKRLRFPYADTAALTMTTLARNSPLSLAIAVAAFPDRPLVSLALVVGPLLELPVLSIISHTLLRIGKKTHLE